jgi:hypothetical protein
MGTSPSFGFLAGPGVLRTPKTHCNRPTEHLWVRS